MGCTSCVECIKTSILLEKTSEVKNDIECNINFKMTEDCHLENSIQKEISNINIILIDDQNSKDEEISSYLKSYGIKNIIPFLNITDAINKIKEIFFEEIIIIVNGKLSFQFIKNFKENLNEIYTIPKIVIFEKDKNNFIKINKENNLFYYNNIKTNRDEIKDFILNSNYIMNVKEKIRNMKQGNDTGNLVFEYIDSKEKLLLPMMYKSLIELTENDKVEEFNEFLDRNYSQKSEYLKNQLIWIRTISNIPIELLSKYYIRFYTDEDSKFYSVLNKDFRNNKKDNYITFIKVLYEGIKLKSLPICSDKKLYRGSKLSNEEINLIEKYINSKHENLPGAIVFSKTFLSFTKDRTIAENFLNSGSDNNKLSNILFILRNDDKMNYISSTHADIENISLFPNEKEVLFFPFSSFEIRDIKPIKGQKTYEIELLYLGKYLKEILKDKNLFETEENIPNTEFKKEIIKFGLIKSESIQNKKSVKILFENYENYKHIVINKNSVTKINKNSYKEKESEKYIENKGFKTKITKKEKHSSDTKIIKQNKYKQDVQIISNGVGKNINNIKNKNDFFEKFFKKNKKDDLKMDKDSNEEDKSSIDKNNDFEEKIQKFKKEFFDKDSNEEDNSNNIFFDKVSFKDNENELNNNLNNDKLSWDNDFLEENIFNKNKKSSQKSKTQEKNNINNIKISGKLFEKNETKEEKNITNNNLFEENTFKKNIKKGDKTSSIFEEVNKKKEKSINKESVNHNKSEVKLKSINISNKDLNNKDIKNLINNLFNK